MCIYISLTSTYQLTRLECFSKPPEHFILHSGFSRELILRMLLS